MQDRYAGDVGDFVKLGLLRALSKGRKLGVAWYRYPDENKNSDGRHINYLNKPELYQHLDLDLFDHLNTVVATERSIRSLQPILDLTASSGQPLDPTTTAPKDRPQWRREWFQNVLEDLQACDLIFADPDNGIVDDSIHRITQAKFGKQIPLSEVRRLAEDRCAIIYHHNTRRRGGHDLEVDHWLSEIGLPSIAIRAKAFSPRTFFIVNPDSDLINRANAFCKRWKGLKVSIDGATKPQSTPSNAIRSYDKDVASHIFTRITTMFDTPVIQNNLRGLWVEAMICELLGPDWKHTGADWAAWDIEHKDGTKIEVKQSAVAQTWGPSNSAPRFDIKAAAGHYPDGKTYVKNSEGKRYADIYVFAWHDGSDQRNPDEWEFYVVMAKDLPEGQKSIGLSGVRELSSVLTAMELAECVGKVTFS